VNRFVDTWPDVHGVGLSRDFLVEQVDCLCCPPT